MEDTEPSWLIPECIVGNQDAIELLVRRYETGVFRLALSMARDPAEAQEITQETFLAALRSLRTYQERNSFRAWLYRIAINQGRRYLRKRRARERLYSTLAGILRLDHQKQASPEEALIQDEKEAAIWNELNRLDERHRTVLVLRYFQELSVAEISEVLTLSEGTVHSRLHYARERLRDALRRLHGENDHAHDT